MSIGTGFLILKLVHIVSAIVAVGANLTYGVWFAAADAHPAAAPLLLRTVKLIDDRIANPAYGLLLVTGAVMVWVGRIGFATPWVAWALGLFAVVGAIAFAGYTPTLKRHVAAVERGGTTDPDSVQLAKRGQLLAAVMGILVLIILVLMVFKPQ
jgi:uncharacterized membrane protein